ncbi:MAG: hypothetical protein PHN69_05475 [Candidatus Pacebacteria bacterium]|nr:hypothetical protein [Candidatus Paceibacterota bacterium]
MKHIDWFMNPVFSQNFVSKVEGMAGNDWGLMILCLLKIFIIFATLFVFALPFIPFMKKVQNKLF